MIAVVEQLEEEENIVKIPSDTRIENNNQNLTKVCGWGLDP